MQTPSPTARPAAAPDALAAALDRPLQPLAGLACTHCHQPMRAVALEGHYGNTQHVDVCAACHLVWFDAFESVRLSGLGWIALLRAMHAAMSQRPGTLAAQVACPRCEAPLKPVHNLTRFGRTAGLECPRRHGQYQTFSLLLAERGLVRPLLPGDRTALDEESRPLCCLNCGAGIGAVRGDACPYCDSPLVVFDMPRLMSSLLIRDAIPLPAERAEHVAWACRACGAAVDPTRMTQCPQCTHTVVAPALDDVVKMLDTVEPLLRGHGAPARKPHGAWVHQRSHRDTGLHRVLRTFAEEFYHGLLPGRGGARLLQALVLVALLLAVWWWR